MDENLISEEVIKHLESKRARYYKIVGKVLSNEKLAVFTASVGGFDTLEPWFSKRGGCSECGEYHGWVDERSENYGKPMIWICEACGRVQPF